MENGHGPVAAHDVFLGVGGLAFYAIILALMVVPYWVLWKRTGHAGAWGLLMLIPLANIVSLWVLAFKEWPAMRGPRS
jgi:hypothetical protein